MAIKKLINADAPFSYFYHQKNKNKIKNKQHKILSR